MANTDEPSSRILITGAAGFIGQALATALLTERTVRSIVLTDVVSSRMSLSPQHLVFRQVDGNSPGSTQWPWT